MWKLSQRRCKYKGGICCDSACARKSYDCPINVSQEEDRTARVPSLASLDSFGWRTLCAGAILPNNVTSFITNVQFVSEVPSMDESKQRPVVAAIV